MIAAPEREEIGQFPARRLAAKRAFLVLEAVFLRGCLSAGAAGLGCSLGAALLCRRSAGFGKNHFSSDGISARATARVGCHGRTAAVRCALLSSYCCKPAASLATINLTSLRAALLEPRRRSSLPMLQRAGDVAMKSAMASITPDAMVRSARP